MNDDQGTCLTKSRRCALSAPQVVRRVFIAADELDGCAADQKYLPAMAQRKPKRERPLSQVAPASIITGVVLGNEGLRSSLNRRIPIHPAFAFDRIEQFIGRPFNVRVPSRFSGMHQ